MKSIETVQADLIKFGAMKTPVDLKAAFDSAFWAKVPDADKKM